MSATEEPATVDAGPVLPAEALVLGPRDALVVLGLRVVRRSTWLLIPLGAAVALLAGVSQDRISTEFDTPSEWLHALLSPLWLLALGILLRIAVGPLAFAVAVAVTMLGDLDVRATPDRRRRDGRLGDGLRVAGGLRALRWSLAVRDHATELAGTPGAWMRRTETVAGWLIGVAWALLAVLLLLRSR